MDNKFSQLESEGQNNPTSLLQLLKDSNVVSTPEEEQKALEQLNKCTDENGLVSAENFKQVLGGLAKDQAKGCEIICDLVNCALDPICEAIVMARNALKKVCPRSNDPNTD